MKDLEHLLESRGVKATANRVLVLKALYGQEQPLSLSELEERLVSMDKSSIFRALTRFVEHHVVHSIEDGAGVIRYEICTGHDECTIEDMHVHFYCEECKSSKCFTDIQIPKVDIPEGYDVHSITYMIKGVCPKCGKKERNR